MIYIAQDEAAFVKKAAQLVLETFSGAIEARKRATWALCGGRTPQWVFPKIAEAYYRERIDWKNVLIFWGDERCVPPDHKDSNYKLAKDLMLSKVPVPAENIYRMAGEMTSPHEAARAYETQLKNIFKYDRPFPKFDLIWLGMGEDGHTASLFPGTSALEETEKWVVGHHVERLSSNRLTLTIPVINNARRVVVLCPGESKAPVLRDLFHPLASKNRYPIQRVHPTGGELIWLLDKAAATKLPPDIRNKAQNI
ncbi:MAG: 6-phosphogluconolactonase [Elusimicrobia bacterium]|nr:6-phosphogluconolactonase [Elusimicrobiota bacterium]